MANDDDWEFEIDNGQIESLTDRMNSIAAAEAREKRLEERRLQEEADRALTEDLFAEGRTFGVSVLPSVQMPSPPKKQDQYNIKNPSPKKMKMTVKLPALTLKKPERTEKVSKAKQKYIEAELFGDSTYLTQDELIGCEYEDEYYNR
jgi:hypothetical protein